MIFYIKLIDLNLHDMGNSRKCTILILLLLYSVNIFSQKKFDSLNVKKFNQLFEIFQKSSNFELQKSASEEIIKNAKQDKDIKKLVVGYYLSSELYDNTMKLLYCDSIISITSKNSMKLYPSMPFLSKGSFYQKKGDYKNAIDNYLQAKKYASLHNNETLILIINFSIGTLKRKTGEFNQALQLYKSNLPLAKKFISEYNNSTHYLNTLTSISNIYYELKELDSARHYNKLGVFESKKFNDEKSFHHFSANEGIVNFFAGEYDVAIDSLKKHSKYFESINENENLCYTYYYLGEAYSVKGNQKKAIANYKKVDSIYQINAIAVNIIRNSYIRLINYYKSKNDLKNQLHFINSLMSYDSIAYDNEFYLNKTILKEYDIPKLELEKQNVLKKLENKENRFFNTIFYLSVFLLSVILFSIYQYKKKIIYKKRFEKIISKSKRIKSTIISYNHNLPKEVVNKILMGLEEFEKKNSFLSNNINLNNLAKKLNTNSNYLSKIINQYKKESFSNYLNKLRIEYIVEELKTNSTYRKYTIKAISEISGFNNAESFSKAFYKYIRLKPSYFITELEKKVKRDS